MDRELHRAARWRRGLADSRVDHEGGRRAAVAPASVRRDVHHPARFATFTVGTEEIVGKAGQILVVPAETPHKFRTGPGGYEAVHIHANATFETTWLE
jgi:hypothetical protein